MTSDILFWTIGDCGGNPLPKWARTIVCVAGEAFVPAVIADDELQVSLCATADNEQTVIHLGHVFVRARWMRVEYPATAELLDLIERRVSDAVAGHLEPRQKRSNSNLALTPHG